MIDLFDLVQDAIDTADFLTVEYEQDTGQVIFIDVDRIKNAVDDEVSFAERDLTLR